MYGKYRAVRLRLCEILVKNGLISQEGLERALRVQKGEGGRIGEILVRMRMVREEDIASTLASQMGIPYLSLENIDADFRLLKIVPADFAVREQAFPICLTGNILTVAMSDPLDFKAIEDLERITGCRVEPVVAMATAIRKAIDEFYEQSEKKKRNEQFMPQGDLLRAQKRAEGLKDSELVRGAPGMISPVPANELLTKQKALAKELEEKEASLKGARKETSRVRRLVEALRKAHEKVKVLNSHLENKEQAYGKAQEEFSHLEKRLKELEAERERVTREDESKRTALNAQITELKTRHDRFAQELEAKERALADARKETERRAQLERELKDTQAQLASQKKTHEGTLREYQTAEKRLKELEAERERVTREDESKRTALNAQITELKTRHDRFAQELEAKERALADARKEAERRAQLERELKDTQAQLASQKKTHEGTVQEYQIAEKRLQELDTAHARLKSEMTEKERETQTLRDKVLTLQGEVELAQKAVAEKKGQIEDTQSKLLEVDKEQLGERDRRVNLEKLLARQNEALVNLEHKAQHTSMLLKEKEVMLEARTKEVEERSREYQGKLSRAEAERDRMALEVQQKNESLESFKREADGLRSDMAKKESELKELRAKAQLFERDTQEKVLSSQTQLGMLQEQLSMQEQQEQELARQVQQYEEEKRVWSDRHRYLVEELDRLREEVVPTVDDDEEGSESEVAGRSVDVAASTRVSVGSGSASIAIQRTASRTIRREEVREPNNWLFLVLLYSIFYIAGILYLILS
ncbi:MAG: hypothetical protein HYY14_04755 [Candidatus Omnitrophica bacterium]|nr:hypothetical protein [Candidatus Omnitrophota bacterium]